MTSKVQPAADYWTVDRVSICHLILLGTRNSPVFCVRKMEKFDADVGVSSSSRKRTSRSCICLVILSVAVVLLITISAIFVTLYVKTITLPSTEKPSATTFPTTQKTGEQKYCGSKTCLLATLGKLIFPPGLIRVYTMICLISFDKIF